MTITEEKFMEVLTNGTQWSQKDIRDHLYEYVSDIKNCPVFGYHYIMRDSMENLYYMYDNECYLFIEDEKIIIRCDRENVWSEGMTHKIAINNAKDIELAYETFKSMTMEDENETEE